MDATLETVQSETPIKPWVLYLLECAGDRLYAGITNDLVARFKAHCSGRGAHFTRGFPPVRILAACELASRSDALKAEYALKQQPRSRKLQFLSACGALIDVSGVAGQPQARARAFEAVAAAPCWVATLASGDAHLGATGEICMLASST